MRQLKYPIGKGYEALEQRQVAASRGERKDIQQKQVSRYLGGNRGEPNQDFYLGDSMDDDISNQCQKYRGILFMPRAAHELWSQVALENVVAA